MESSFTTPASGTTAASGTTTTPGASGRTASATQPTRPIKAQPPTFTYAAFKTQVDLFSLAKDGDRREQQFCSAHIDNEFPAYEKAWRLLILPATNRLTNGDMDLRADVSNKVKSMCQFHYSMMRSLLLANGRITQSHDGSMEEFIMFTENALEQAEIFLIFWLINFVSIRPKELRKIDLGNNQLEKRKARVELLNEHFRGFAWGEFREIRKQNQKIRDSLLHGPVPLTVIDGNQELYPDFESLLTKDPWKHPQFWRNLTEGHANIQTTRFAEGTPIKQEHLKKVLSRLNQLWEKELPNWRKQFFQQQPLRNYHLQITNIP